MQDDHDSPPPASAPHRQLPLSVKKLGWTLAIGVAAWVGLLVLRQTQTPFQAHPAPQPALPGIEQPISPSSPAPAEEKTEPEKTQSDTPEQPSPPPLIPVILKPHADDIALPPAPSNDDAVRTLDAQLKLQAEEIAQLKIQQQRQQKLLLRLHAYDRLKDALLSSHAFAEELESFRTHVKEEADIDLSLLNALAAYAERGVPNYNTLVNRFDHTIPIALHPATSANAGIGEKILANFSGLVTIRKIGPQEGTTPEAIIGRAEDALSREDVAGAATEITALQGPPAAAFASWLADADAYVTRAKALARLRAAMLESS